MKKKSQIFSGKSRNLGRKKLQSLIGRPSSELEVCLQFILTMWLLRQSRSRLVKDTLRFGRSSKAYHLMQWSSRTECPTRTNWLTTSGISEWRGRCLLPRCGQHTRWLILSLRENTDNVFRTTPGLQLCWNHTTLTPRKRPLFLKVRILAYLLVALNSLLPIGSSERYVIEDYE